MYNPHELFERYIAEIGRNLPSKNRNDIEAEILSTLEDMLRERSEKLESPIDEAMTVSILKECGDPRKIAA